MACLNKLAIRGIRSFDDKNIAIIEFFNPVTVIVGHNGSGKTTIIECLKYATTGDQPPNTKGGAFIHDPKMANETSVKAQVKLRFFAANGDRMITTRNLSVTVKKTGMTMKTLESILALDNDDGEKIGKRAVISTKCAEMDAEIPQLLGVSKAVLENVIFCHQEDSYWPLAEPSALKKKFDDIFEATKYTKALNSIKDLRKERMAELKAEKETLISLSREKAHADKLKERLAALGATISTKELQCEEAKARFEELEQKNKRFYEMYNKFREMFVRLDELNKSQKDVRSTLNEVMSKYTEVPGTLQELQAQVDDFEDNVNQQKQQRAAEQQALNNLFGDRDELRNRQMRLAAEKGGLQMEAEEQTKRIALREQAINDISQKYGLPGLNASMDARAQIQDFLSRLDTVQQKRVSEYEGLQTELKHKNEEYQDKLRVLDKELERQKMQKQNIKEQITERQQNIRSIERKVEDMESIPLTLETLKVNIADKTERVKKVKDGIVTANYDGRLAEFSKKARALEEQREELNTELQSLTLQADTRARLDLKRAEVKSKNMEIQNIVELINRKFRSISGQQADPATVEEQVDQVYLEKEGEQTKLQNEARIANTKLQKADLDLNHLNAELQRKRTELRRLDEKLAKELTDGRSLDEEIQETVNEVNHRKGQMASQGVYGDILKESKKSNACSVCTRQFKKDEVKDFEKNVAKLINAALEANIETLKEELEEWEEQLENLQKLRPVKIQRDTLKNKEIPALEKDVQEKESDHPALTSEVEKIAEKVEAIAKQVKDLLTLKQQASTVGRLNKDVERATQDIARLENSLLASGSTRTADDVQNDLGKITADLRKNERESKALTLESDRQNKLIHELEADLHRMAMEELTLKNNLAEKERLEKDAVRMREEIEGLLAQSKNVDAALAEARAPHEALQAEYRRVQKEMDARINQAQQYTQELNRSVDQLSDMNKNIQRYVQNRRERMLNDCTANLQQCDQHLRDLEDQISGVERTISGIDKEINQSGSTISNLRDNIIVQKLNHKMNLLQEEIDSYSGDLEDAYKAKRNFDTDYPKYKAEEDASNEQYHQRTGELGSLKAQLKTLEADLRDFKNVYKNYTEQLIKVKVSDMANNDLEKYAKALDSAIMKYHGLKMEEVNDTMKHLWNKTYQGTDIDGIKIQSDAEGGATKRSYNYRVVMTKDQVEMDMRGRCSAGQKMLASIIIRLALSDSFGQNCGILALDEPTNALDTENIDALASSLVDIINERKSHKHSNFQLIIITHDENFLRRLGQADVMEHYWRVCRDAKQKSVIQRQRFR